MKKIAILAFHFKPEQVVGAIRPENWADWLSEDYEVVVITRHGCIEGEGQSPYKIAHAKSILIRMIDILNGWRLSRKRALAPSLNNPSKGGGSKRSYGIISYRMPCLYDFWLWACYRSLKSHAPDMIIATHSPYISLLVGWVYKVRHPGTKLWLDFRDLWTTGHVTKGMWPFSLLEKKLEASALRDADVVTTVSAGLKKDIRIRSNQKKGDLVYNAPGKKIKSGDRSQNNSDDASLVISYTGTGYVGWRDPSPLFSLLAGLRSEGVITKADVKFVLASRNPGNILDLAAQFDIMEYVDFRGAVSRDDAIRIQQNSDVLMLMESSDPEAAGVLTGKVFEYLNTTKPILLIGPGPGSELYELLESHNRLLDINRLSSTLRSKSQLDSGEAIDYSLIAKTQLLSIAKKQWQ